MAEVQKPNGIMKTIGMIMAVLALLAAVMVPASFVFKEMHEDIQQILLALVSVEDHSRGKRGEISDDIKAVEKELEDARLESAYRAGRQDERTEWLMKLEARQ